MSVRLEVRDEYAQAVLGTVTSFSGLRFSADTGGSGGIGFTVPRETFDAIGMADCTVVVQLWDGAGWVPGEIYAVRPPWQRPNPEDGTVTVQGTALLEAWAADVAVWPESAGPIIPRGAGEQRGVGWMMTAYDPEDDPREPWNRCYNTARSALPPDFPAGSGAKWISVTGATDLSERKFLRGWVEVTSGPQLVGLWFSSDESATVWVAAEPVLETSSVETGRDTTTPVTMVLGSGRWAVAVDTTTDFTKGGDGVDPVILAMAVLDDDGDPVEWLLVSDEDAFVACRRDDAGPGSEPPGPTPGAALRAMLAQAADRGVSGWPGVSYAFDGELDSGGADWPAVVIERSFSYGFDSLAAVLGALGETGELDVHVGPDLVVRAWSTRGVDRSATVIIGPGRVTDLSDVTGGEAGSVLLGHTKAGWIQEDAAGAGQRREAAMELGTVLSAPVARRVLTSALGEQGRWDGSVQLTSEDPVRPLLDFWPGDVVGVDLPGYPARARVLSVSAQDTDGGLLWDVELSDEDLP